MTTVSQSGSVPPEEAIDADASTRSRPPARAALAAAPGNRLLDVGCGPGFCISESRSHVNGGVNR